MVVVERGKRLCYSPPSHRHLLSGPSSKTLDCRPRSGLYSSVVQPTSVTDGCNATVYAVMRFCYFFVATIINRHSSEEGNL